MTPQSASAVSFGGGYIYSAVTSNGQLTPTLTWTLDSGETTLAPAPAQVSILVTITCSASSVGTSATASDGFGDSFPGTGSATSCGGTYTHLLQADNSSLSTTVTLPGFSASAAGSKNADGSGSGYVNASITVTTQVTNLRLGFMGTTPGVINKANPNILVGQGCTATVTGATSGSTYQWSVTGTTFQSWTASASSAVLSSGPGPLTGSSAHWYWNDAAATVEKVACNVTLAGQSSPIIVQGLVIVRVPTVSAANNLGVGYVGPYNSAAPVSVFASPSALMRNLGYADGSTWVTSVSLPTTAAFSGTGKWGYAQIITPGEYLIADDGTKYPGNTTVGLDGGFPYRASTHPTDGLPYNDGDSPALPTADTFKSVQLTDFFKTYLMFQPPGSDVQWVPLQESDWSTNFNASRPSTGHWTDFPPNTSVGPVVGSTFKPQTIHPTW